MTEIANDIRDKMRKEVLLLITWRRTNVNRAGGPIVFASVAVGLFKVFEIFSHPRFVAVAEVDEGRVALAQVLVVIVH